MNVKTLQITCVTDSSACVTFQNRGPARARVSFITEVHNNLFIIAADRQNIFSHFCSCSVFFMVGAYLQSSKSQSKEKENQSMKGQIA